MPPKSDLLLKLDAAMVEAGLQPAPRPTQRRRGRPSEPIELLIARGRLRDEPGRTRARRGDELPEGTATQVEQELNSPSIPPKNYVALAEQYAADVLSGKLPAGKWVKLSCARHQRDRAREGAEGFPYRFDVELANKFSSLGERYPHIKGRWAGKRERLSWEGWQCFINIQFGWVHAATGKRRFNEFYVEVPRKNAKSTTAAAIGNNLLLDDGEHGPEVYAGATSEKQAWEVFGPARLMLEKSPKILKQYNVEVNARTIVKLDDAGRFWPLIGKPGDGASPSCAIVDEYHEHNSSDLVDTMVTGMGAREQPVLLIITTAGTNLASPCYDKHKEAQKVLEGALQNERLFAIIYAADLPEGDAPGDDWTKPDTLRKANPNIGVSVDEDYLLAQQRNAVLNPAYQNRFKTKHLNIWCSASVAGINMHHWQLAADKQLNIEEFAGQEALVILDLASKTDICANVQLFQKRIDGLRHYYLFGKYYLPEDTIEESKHNQMAYRKWVAQGYLFATPGAELDFDIVEADVMGFSKRHQVLEVVYDPWRATHLAQHLTKAGATCVEIGQTAKNMGSAFDEFLSALKGGRLHHDGNPVLEWMASNVVSKTVAKGLVIPAKEKLEAKIDGIVAGVMGIGRAQAHEPGGGVMDFFQNAVTA